MKPRCSVRRCGDGEYFLSAVWILLFILWLASSAGAADKRNYSMRPFYPYVQTISTDRLMERYVDAIVIDVRNHFEFDVIHINKAHNIPLSEENFIDLVSRHRARSSKTPLIFYCNSPACSSAFRAAVRAQHDGFENVFVYDAGVFALLDVAPEKITLMATTPAQPDLVIPPDYAAKVLLDFTAFNKQSTGLNALVVDVRDSYNQTYVPCIQGIRNIPLEAFLTAVTNRIWFGKNLLIFDHDGTRVRWLQYFLQANGYSGYAFLRGGVAGLNLETQAKKIVRHDSWVTVHQHRFAEMVANSALTPLELRLMNLLLASIRSEYYGLVRSSSTAAVLQCSDAELQRAMRGLQGGGYLLFGANGDTLVFHVNPRLVWKGMMSGPVWESRVREFDAATSPPGVRP